MHGQISYECKIREDPSNNHIRIAKTNNYGPKKAWVPKVTISHVNAGDPRGKTQGMVVP